jgi:hypothetical protein
MSNECLDAAIATLREAGVYNYQISRGTKHLQLRWEVNGMPRFHVLPGSPSDRRPPNNVRADIRRMLKADGLLVDAPTTQEKPRRLSVEQRLQRLEQLVAGLTEKG